MVIISKNTATFHEEQTCVYLEETSLKWPPSNWRILEKRTPLTKGTLDNSFSSKFTSNLNFFFFILAVIRCYKRHVLFHHLLTSCNDNTSAKLSHNTMQVNGSYDDCVHCVTSGRFLTKTSLKKWRNTPSRHVQIKTNKQTNEKKKLTKE